MNKFKSSVLAIVLSSGLMGVCMEASAAVVHQQLSAASQEIISANVNPVPVNTVRVIHGLTITNSSAQPVTFTLVKDATTKLVVIVKGDSTLSIPFSNGLYVAPTDILTVNLSGAAPFAMDLTVDYLEI